MVVRFELVFVEAEGHGLFGGCYGVAEDLFAQFWGQGEEVGFCCLGGGGFGGEESHGVLD